MAEIHFRVDIPTPFPREKLLNADRLRQRAFIVIGHYLKSISTLTKTKSQEL